MIQKITRTVIGLTCGALLTLTGCSDHSHDMPETGAGCISIGLNTDSVTDIPLNNAHLYFFDADGKCIQHKYYADMKELASDRLQIKLGQHTIFAVLNTAPEAVPWEEIAPSTKTSDAGNFYIEEFTKWMVELEKSDLYPDMLSGTLQYEIKDGLALIMIDLKPGTGDTEDTDKKEVTLSLTYPSPLLPDYIPARSGETVRLRAVIEAYRRGTDERVMRKATFVEKINEEGLHTAVVILPQGEYDLRIWGDYVAEADKDYHYNTTDTKKVEILPIESYEANTDTRDCFAQTDTVTVGGSALTKTLTLNRPLAKYRLVADDIARYRKLMTTNDYPPLEELTITVQYEGFLPCSFDATTGKPSDAKGGYSYNATLPEITPSMTEVEISNDYVFVNGDESAVTVTVLVKDKTGKTISRVQGVEVKYKRGMLTTITGEFLTAGVVNPGINIDTDWEDEYNVTF